MSLSRRALLRGAALGGAGLAASRSLGVIGRVPAFASDERDAINDLLSTYATAYEQPGVPRGLQLSFVGDHRSTRTVTWLTSDTAGPSVVQWASISANADVTEITAADLVSSNRGWNEAAPFGYGDEEDFVSPVRTGGSARPGERQVFIHRATITGLAPGQRVAYRVGDGETWSAIRDTRTSPAREDGFRFTHVGDHGPKLAAMRTTAALLDRQPDWHLFAGDLTYANGDQRIWDLWSGQYEVMGGAIPTMASPGNHEAKDFMGETYRRRLTQPNHGASYYAYAYDNVFLVSTPAGAFFGDRDGAMEDVKHELVWMEHTLARAAAMRAAGLVDFIVVTQHFPSYTDHRTRGPISADRVVAAEQILQRYQIDLLLVGHDHMYQRSHPMAYGQATVVDPYQELLTGEGTKRERYSNSTGYIQVIAGAGGNGLYDFTEVGTLDPRVDEENPFQRHMPWLASSARKLCFAEYHVRGPEMDVTGFGWPDGYDDNVGNGVDEDEPGYDGNDRRFLDHTEPEVIDRFTLVRKAYAADVPTVPRSARDILAGVPEAHGKLVYDRSEDCTLHDH